MPPRSRSEFLLTASLCLFSFSIVFSVTAAEAALFLALALTLYKARRESPPGTLRRAVAGHPLFLPWAVYLCVCAAAAAAAFFPARGFGQLGSEVIRGVCCFTLLLAVRREHVPGLSAAYTAAAALAALVGIGEVFRLVPADNFDINRADAFMNAVRYGEVMGIALLFSLSRAALPVPDSFRHERKFHIAASAVIFAALVLSKTRGAYLGVFTGFLFLLFFSGIPRRRMLLVLASMLVIAAAAVKAVPSVAARFAGLKATVGEILSPAPSGNPRVKMWRVGMKMFRARPLLGVGPGNAKKVFREFCPELIDGRVWGSLHNLYVHQAAERGIAGLGALLFLFGSMFAFARRRFRDSRNPCSLWALCVLPAFYVMNLTEVSFQHVHTSFAVLLALAFSAAASEKG